MRLKTIVRQIASPSTWRLLQVSVAVVIVLAVSVNQASAFAGKYFGSYTPSSLSPADTTYGPSGQVWGDNIFNGSGHEYIQAENRSMSWTATAANNVHSWDHLGPVFHVFDYSTTNCALPFDFDGFWQSSESNAWIYYKNATCSGGLSGYNNEARVYWPASNVASTRTFYGRAEFTINNGNLYLDPSQTGKVSNDIYFNGVIQEKKDNTLKTWCFKNSGNPVSPQAYGC